jgi:hypothetical protein
MFIEKLFEIDTKIFISSLHKHSFRLAIFAAWK